MALINLLPWRQQLREQRRREFFFILGSVAVASLMIWFLLHNTYSHWQEYQDYRNQLLQQEISNLDKKIIEIRDLKRMKESLIARMGIIQELQANRPKVVHLFDEVVNILPKGIYFSSVRLQGNVVTLEGIAVSNTNISQLMRNINNSAWLDNPELKEIKTDDKNGQQMSEFSLQSDLNSSQQTVKK